jgi:Ca-activated chloride channel family protein
MTKNGVHQPLTVQLQADKPVIPAGKAGARILEINLTATGTAQERSRVPLNLALVIDRSGSKHGEKLHFVKEAAAHVIDLLTEQDRAAVVIYDNQVETLMSSQFITDNVKR